MASEKEQFLQTWQQEHATTARVMAAIPEGKLDFRPTPKVMSARELAWHIVGAERFFVEGSLSGNIAPAPGPPAPATLREILSAYERQLPELAATLKAADDRQLAKTIHMPVGPKQMGDVPAMAALWMGVVLHACHHRGQLSTYLRLMEAKVPSIYGPSADEPWW
jgi:uncharacterized damage-inducible protein DinB